MDEKRITSRSHIRKREFLYRWDGQPCFPRGELVAIAGKAKSGKTFFSSILMALSDSQEQLGIRQAEGVKRRPAFFDDEDAEVIDKYRVIWFDTEQSEESTYEIIAERIVRLMGHEEDREAFYAYNLRTMRKEERLDFMEGKIFAIQPDLIIFDGIRDVVKDINDWGEADAVLNRVSEWASNYSCCVVCILHQNKSVEDHTLRGAIGSELMNKCYETYECEKDAEGYCFKVKQTLTRKYEIRRSLVFRVDDEGLPYLMSGSEQLQTAAVPEEQVGNNEDEVALFRYVFARINPQTWDQTRAIVMSHCGLGFDKAGRIIKRAILHHTLHEVEDGKLSFFDKAHGCISTGTPSP